MAQTVKHLPTMRETRVQSLGWEDLLEKEMAPHSSILAWKIPWMEEPGRLQSMGLKESDTTEQLHLLFTTEQMCAHLPNPYHNPTYQEIRFSHHCCCCLVTKSYPTLYNPMDCSLKGSSVHDIFPARILEWGGHFLLQGIFIQGTNPY